MCQICDVEKGNTELLMCQDAEVKIGSRKLTDHVLINSIKRDENGNYGFVSAYYMSDGDYVAMIDMPIQFCPFCGKELQHENPTQYPWNQNEGA